MSSAACEAAPGGQVRLRLVLRDRLAQVEFGANPTIASPLPSPARCHPSAWLGAPTGVPFGVKFAHDHPPSASTSPTCAPWNRAATDSEQGYYRVHQRDDDSPDVLVTGEHRHHGKPGQYQCVLDHALSEPPLKT